MTEEIHEQGTDDTAPIERGRDDGRERLDRPELHVDDGPLGDKPYPEGRLGDYRQDDGEDDLEPDQEPEGI